MIDRYIYAVTRKLPEKSREEIGDEIRGLILDMLEDIDDTVSEEEKIGKVLKSLGDPEKLANKYRDKERYLIGPNYIDKYIFVIKVVSLSIFTGISIASGIGGLFSREGVMEFIGGYIDTLFSALLQGAAWVTGIFAFLEYKEISIDEAAENKEWDPSKLPDISHKKAIISRGESIFSIIFTTIFTAIFFFSPEYVGIYYKIGNDLRFVQVLNLDAYESFRFIILIIFTISIIKVLIKIIEGKWTIRLAIIDTILNIISSILSINIISNSSIWNSDIVQNIEKYIRISFDRILFIVIASIVIITISESLVALYKGFKYGIQKGLSNIIK